MERKPYTVENNRPRRPTRLYGRTLAKKGLGRTSCLDLTEEELLGAPCVRLLQLNRLVLVRGDMPDALVELLSPPEEEVETTPAAVTPDVPASPPVTDRAPYQAAFPGALVIRLVRGLCRPAETFLADESRSFDTRILAHELNRP